MGIAQVVWLRLGPRVSGIVDGRCIVEEGLLSRRIRVEGAHISIRPVCLGRTRGRGRPFVVVREALHREGW